METIHRNNTYFIKMTPQELTKHVLDSKTDEDIRNIFGKLSEKLSALDNNGTFESIVLLVPYSDKDESLYAIHYQVNNKTLSFQKEYNSHEDVEDDDIASDLHPEKMTQPERKAFVKEFLGESKVINGNYDKAAFKKDGQFVFMSHKEIEAPENIGKYGCIPATAYNILPQSFRAKKTGKMWRKLEGIMLDAQNIPFTIGKFNITARQAEDYPLVPRWNRTLIFGRVAMNDYKGQKNQYFEIEGMVASKKLFNDNSSDTGRVELSVHTKYSQMSAECNPHEVWIEAAKKGLHGLAITDNSSVQDYAIAMDFHHEFKHLKPLYGVEMNQVPERPNFVFQPNDIDLYSDDTTYVAFDIETTGLSTIHDNIIQLSAVRYGKTLHTRTKGRGKNKHEEQFFTYDVIDGYDHVVNIGKPIPEFIQELTGISQEDSDKSPYSEKQAIEKFYDFINEYDNTVLIGHNVVFDYNFINNKSKENGLHPIQNEVVDTLPIARRVVKNARSYNLGKLSKKLKIKLDNAHNSRFDAEATGYVFFALLQIMRYGDLTDLVDPGEIKRPKYEKADMEINNGNDLREFEIHGDDIYKENFPSHISLIAKDKQGIKDLYELISEAHIEHFYKTPRIYNKEILRRRNDGHHFLYGSGDIGSKLYDVLTRYGYDQALKLVNEQQYDYLEIVPISSLGWDSDYDYDFTRYNDYLQGMLRLSRETDTLAAISGDVHYTTKKEKEIYDIIMKNKPHSDNKDESVRSANQLKAELRPFLKDEKVIDDIVVQNTLKIADQCEDELKPVHKKLTPPRIEGADEELTEGSWKKAHELYGEVLPKVIVDRINKELKSIIHNGYSVIYLTAKRLVDRSRENGYIVGSRGSVGGSLVAYLTGITEVNSLAPHYRSKYGDYLEFVDPKEWNDGFDLPPKEDPNHPGEYLLGDGHGCSFEIFAGVGGKKVPDIDLNFASDIQNTAQLWLKDVFGEKNVLRVGTVGTVADKTAHGMVKHYEDDFGISYTKTQIDYFSDRIVGLKRTSGQHAAGILIIPQDKEITDFSPYTWPANKQDANWITTMFTKDMMHDSLLKMDCLGHDDPSMLRFMQDSTGVSPVDIDQLQIYDVVQQIYAHPERIKGMPEFGTQFSTQMVKETKPTKFSDLVQISGLSHGKEVWTGNAQDLIKSGKATIQQVIATRDKILNDLMARGYPLEKAHNIIQIIKKHELHLTDDLIAEIKQLGLPDWYIDSIRKITYLFPAAHAVAYVYSACRIAWYKLHYPLSFYSAWISYHGVGLNMEDVLQNDPQLMRQRAQERLQIDSKDRDKSGVTADMIAEALETEHRGFGAEKKIHFVKPSLEHSEPARWHPDEENGLIYLSFDMLPSVSVAIGDGFLRYRDKHDGVMSTHSQDYKDFGLKLPKKAVESLVENGLFED